jgi:hypothetical protein
MMTAIWMQTYDAVFFVSIGTLVIGFFGLVIKYCLKSKCESVKLCCGLCEINRRVDLETAVEMHEIDVNGNITDLPGEGLEEISRDRIPQLKPPSEVSTARLKNPNQKPSYHPIRSLEDGQGPPESP